MIPIALASSVNSAEEGVTMMKSVFEFSIKISVVVAFIFIFMILGRILYSYIFKKFQQSENYEGHKDKILIFKRLINMISILIGATMGLAITGLLGSLGWLVGSLGLALGWGLQNVFSNFFAGITILLQGKIKINDIIEIQGKDKITGKVINIETRTTDLLLFDGTTIIIPNSDFFTYPIRLLSKNDFRRIHVNIDVGYETNFDLAYKVVLDTLDNIQSVEKEPMPTILTKEIKDSNIGLEIRFWIKTGMQWWIIKSNVLRNIFINLQKAGIHVSYPVRTLRVDNTESDQLYNYITKQKTTNND